MDDAVLLLLARGKVKVKVGVGLYAEEANIASTVL